MRDIHQVDLQKRSVQQLESGSHESVEQDV